MRLLTTLALVLALLGGAVAIAPKPGRGHGRGNDRDVVRGGTSGRYSARIQ